MDLLTMRPFFTSRNLSWSHVIITNLNTDDNTTTGININFNFNIINSEQKLVIIFISQSHIQIIQGH